ncbi:hypothetical protein [Burkholderia pseudomallei]|uniref:hypothetical protein n=1 Tax=Burkholderia pseudomallei TaxID=28450 RepID=UPI001AD7AE30|nr:hypothetical protein [Burkholderia pseudomallei]MBO7749309.1 hypothetical protein [Burkholderia pseudomallei]
MVLVFFCISGVLGAIDRHPSITTPATEAAATRSLDIDSRLFGKTIEPFQGAVVVIANDWPFIFGLNTLRQGCVPFGHRIVNSVRLIGGRKEDSILKFMASRSEPYAVVASSDFEFSEVTAGNRVNVGLEAGFDDEAAGRLRALLEGYGEAAKRPVSTDEVMRATVDNPWVRRVQSYLAPSQAANHLSAQRRLAAMLYAPGAGST